MEEASETLLGFSEVSFDLETTGLDTHAEDLEIVGLGFTYKPKQGFYIPVNYEHGLSVEEILDIFREVLEDDCVGLIGQNIKYDARVCRRYGITLQHIKFDTFVAHYCLYGDRFPHNLDDMSMQFLNLKKIRTKTLIPKKTKANPNPSMKDMPVEDVGHYCMEDTDTTFQLYQHMKELLDLEENSFAKELFYKIELPFLPVLIEMECNGSYVDIDYLDKLHNKYISRIKKYTDFIYKKVGKVFSLTAPSEIAEALYDILKIPEKLGITIPTTSKSGQKKTDKETLEKLEEEPVVRALLKVKEYQKLLKTYVVGLTNSISPVTGLIHGSFNQCQTATGRLSSSNPNLQNIPSRTQEGKAIRKAFISRWQGIGGHIYACDLSQAELRVLAALSGDKTLIKAYEEDKDIHDAVARVSFKLPKDQPVPKDIRAKAKSVSFGLVYGMKANKLANQLKIPKADAQKIIDDYLDGMPGVKRFLDESEQFTYMHGYSETLCKRRRYVPKAFSDNVIDQWAAARESTNFLIQGLNADIMKIAMIDIQEKIQRHNLKSLMILQVHDEVVFDVYPGEIEKLQEIVTFSMENALSLDVKLVAEGAVADNWSDAH